MGQAAIAKATAYAVLTPPAGVNIAKAVGYAVLAPWTEISGSTTITATGSITDVGEKTALATITSAAVGGGATTGVKVVGGSVAAGAVAGGTVAGVKVGLENTYLLSMGSITDTCSVGVPPSEGVTSLVTAGGSITQGQKAALRSTMMKLQGGVIFTGAKAGVGGAPLSALGVVSFAGSKLGVFPTEVVARVIGPAVAAKIVAGDAHLQATAWGVTHASTGWSGDTLLSGVAQSSTQGVKCGVTPTHLLGSGAVRIAAGCKLGLVSTELTAANTSGTVAGKIIAGETQLVAVGLDIVTGVNPILLEIWDKPSTIVWQYDTVSKINYYLESSSMIHRSVDRQSPATGITESASKVCRFFDGTTKLRKYHG